MKPGRPTRYRPSFAEEARTACARGACDKGLARRFSVNVATIYRWRHRHPAFAEAMATGKRDADDRVEQALYQRAVGFEYRHDPRRHRVLADPRAALQWLRIRRPEQWRVKPRSADAGDIARDIEAGWQRVLDGRGRDDPA